MMEASLSIVVPVFNEEQNLTRLYATWTSVCSKLRIPYHFVFINDGSTDNSLQVLESFAAADESVRIINQTNQGHGPAILKGYQLALDAEWIMQMDADNPYDPQAFEMMWKQKEDYDFLVGDRLEKSANLSRKLISMLSVLAVGVLVGKLFRNVNTPYRLMRATEVKNALKIIPADSFAPNMMLSMYFIKCRKRNLIIPLSYQQASGMKKSTMSSYIAGGAVKSLFQLLQFSFRL